MEKTQDGLYFGYGSNLDQADWRHFCERNGVETEPLTPVSQAWLPDYRLICHYYSSARQGGALNVVSSLGQVTPGMLFRVQARGWELLDRKEGAPFAYQRIPVHVLTDDGEIHTAATYQVIPSRREPSFVAPTDAYAALVRRALERWELPTHAHAQVMAGQAPDPLVLYLFVYGLLQSGYEFGRFLDGHCQRTPASAPGRLFDLGAYPAWQPAQAPQQRVQGELLSLSNPVRLLERTDAAEGFEGYRQKDRSHYHRVLVRARTAAGHEELAWCYRYALALVGARPIPDGCWRHEQEG